jgi:hypothetical protein
MANEGLFSELGVLDIASFIAGSAATNALSDFGAEVIKVRSEIDNVVLHVREALATSPGGLLDLPYAPNDLREQARLCIEDAEAATETAVSRAFASRAFLLAQVAEVIARRAEGQTRAAHAVINAAA